MRRMYKLIGVPALCAMMALPVSAAPMQRVVLFNGNDVQISQVVDSHRTLVSIDGLKGLGVDVKYDKVKKTASIKNGMTTVEISVGSKEVKIYRDADFSGIPEKRNLDVAAKMVRNTMYVPLRAIFEIFGDTVTIGKNGEILITGINATGKIYQEVNDQDVISVKEINDWVEKNKASKGIYYMNYKDSVYVLATVGEKPTLGYGISVDTVDQTAPDKVLVYAHATAPKPGMMQGEMITYPHVLLKLNVQAKTVTGEVADMTDQEKPVPVEQINLKDVKSASIYDLDYKKIRDINGKELESTVEAYNAAYIVDRAYIKIIAGNSLEISLNDDTVIRFTSYGNKEYVVSSVTKGDKSSPQHLYSPALAELLLK